MNSNESFKLKCLLKNKKLLVLGGAAQHIQAVKAAKALGVYVIVTDIKEKTEAKELADESLNISLMDSDALIEWCRNNPVDGVLNANNDFAQRSHQRLCEEFGFYGYGSAKQYDCLTDKQKFKNACLDNGLDVIPAYEETELDSVEFPVLVKPAESSGSRGAQICYEKKTFGEAVETSKNNSRNGKVIIEKYMNGYPDVEIVYYINNGTPHLMWMGDRYLGKKEVDLHRQCVCFVSPTSYIDDYLKNTHEKVCKMIKRLGINNSPVFFQGFVDGDTVRFYDPGIRFPGDEFASIVKNATGIDLMTALVVYALTGKTILNDDELEGVYNLNDHYGTLYQLQANPGKLTKFAGLDEIMRLPFVTNAVQKRFEGEYIENTGDLNRRIGEIAIMTKKNVSSIKESIVQIRKLLSVEDDEGNNLLSDAFDVNTIK